MKEVFTKRFWQGVKETFDQAREGLPPRSDQPLQTPAEGDPRAPSCSATQSSSATPSSPSVPSGTSESSL
jgi:hypothetical protein